MSAALPQERQCTYASVYSLENGAYHAAAVYGADSRVPVGVLDACTIDLSAVFSET